MTTRTRRIRWSWLIAASLALLAFLLVIAQFMARLGAVPTGPRPLGSVDDIAALAERDDVNVLFILIDTLRSDRLSAYGYERETSPNLARLASGGIRFTRHMSQSSWTKSSMASLWTGSYPARTGVTRFDDILSEAAQLPAEILKSAGFETIGLYRNGWVSPNFGFSQGFDVYSRPAPRPIPPTVRRENPTATTVGADDDVITTAIEYLRINGDSRWFLYLHLMDIHEYTYDTESALFGGTYSDIYDNAIRRVDGLLEVLFEYLAESGLADRTIIVIAADHGEAFRERGDEGHARRVFKETTEVPWIVALPFRLDPGIVVTTRTRNVDIWPTIIDLLGLESPEGLDGRSRVADILASGRGEVTSDPETTGIAHLDMTWGQTGMDPIPTVAVADGPFRYVKIQEDKEAREYLFDATTDPRELTDRADANPEKLLELRKIGEEYLEQVPTWGAAPTRELSEMELNQLRALGYALP